MALTTVDQLVYYFFESIHVLQLVVDDAALHEFIIESVSSSLRPNLFIPLVLENKLLLLVDELLLHD